MYLYIPNCAIISCIGCFNTPATIFHLTLYAGPHIISLWGYQLYILHWNRSKIKAWLMERSVIVCFAWWCFITLRRKHLLDRPRLRHDWSGQTQRLLPLRSHLSRSGQTPRHRRPPRERVSERVEFCSPRTVFAFGNGASLMWKCLHCNNN